MGENGGGEEEDGEREGRGEEVSEWRGEEEKWRNGGRKVRNVVEDEAERRGKNKGGQYI